MSDETTTTTDVDEVFDLDRASAEQRSKRKPWKVRFRGELWELSNLYSSVDLKTIEGAQEGDIPALRQALTRGLGEEPAERLNIGSLLIDEMVLLFEHWSEASGAEPGESVASSGS